MGQKHLPENIVDDRGALVRCEAGLPATRTQLATVNPEQLHRLDKICIEGLEVFANHGVFPEENKLGQKFVVSVTLYTDTRRAGEADDLSASVHYGEAARAIDEFLRAQTFKLIEAAAEGTAAMLLNRYPSVYGVHIRLEKPWAPVGLPLKTVAVEIERTR